MTSTTIEIEFPEGSRITVPQEIPQSDDLCPHEGIRIHSSLRIDGNRVVYIQGDAFESHRYSIDDKEVMADVFRVLNALHKMNLVIEKA